MSLNLILNELNPVHGRVHLAHYEAYCNSSGYLDCTYINHVTEQRFNQKALNNQVNKAFGAAAFLPSKEPVELMTFEEFKEIYEFGKYPNVRDYILYAFDNTGKVLTRDNLFSWVQEL